MRILQAAVRVSALLALAFALANSTALAQEATGKIVGTITDPKGGVIPGAKITVTNVATLVTRETTTDRDGFYQVLSLPIGTYRVTVEHPGFRKGAVDNQTLRINQVLRIDFQLELGSPTEVVEVTAQVAGVETVNHTLGQVVTGQAVTNLPLNGRNVLTLALLQPGVTETNPNSPGLFSVAGGRADSVTFLLDGGVNNNLLSNLVVLNPNPETIAEFRILTSNYTAEYGRNAGGIVSVVTKSGTNSIHGSAYDYLRNEAFNANTFIRNAQGLPREVLKRNQFGFTVGAPILIPKVVNGKDRFFFFFAYQGQRLSSQQTQPAVTVFTPRELAGDFSQSGSGGTPDPNVVAYLNTHPFFQSDPAKRNQGIIDPARINTVAQNYIKAGLIPTSTTGRLFPTGSQKNDHDEVTGKFDVNINSKDKLAVTLGALRNPLLNPFSVEANVPGFPTTTQNHRYLANFAYTRTASPNLLNEFRFNTQRNNNFQAVPARQLPKPRDLGIMINSDNPTGPTQLSFGSGLTLGFNRNGPTDLVDNTFSFSDTVSWIRGKHTLKFGGTLIPYQDNTVFDFFINGRFRFTAGRFTSNNFADFLLGLPRTYLQFPEAPSNIRTKAFYTFAQDEWRLLRNLTLTFGIRYEYSQPKLDTKGRSFSLQLGQQSRVFTKAPVGILFPGDPGAPVGANLPDTNDFAPRLGIAWDPTGSGKTSIRAGFGVFYDILKGEDNLQFNGQAPFFGFASITTFRALSTNPSSEPRYLSDPFGSTGTPNSFPSKPPAPDINFATAGFLPIGDAGVFFVDPNLRTPYTYQYNLSIQRQIVPNLILEASYVGSSSHKLTDLVDANPFVLGNENIVRRFNTQPGAADSFSFLNEFRNVVTASYNSLQFSVQKQQSSTRFFGSTAFTFAYTYAHGIDNGSGFRERNSKVPFYNPHLFRGSTDFDLTHRITFSGVWDLPFDRLWSSGPRRVTKGWSLSPIIFWRAGFPLDVFAGSSFFDDQNTPGPSGAGDGGLVRALLVRNGVTVFTDPRVVQTFTNPSIRNSPARTGNFWFNPANFIGCARRANFCQNGLDDDGTAAVTNPALRTYGSLPRNFFRGPGRFNFDLAVAKATPLVGERLQVEFRAEFFNLFNRAEFDNPSTLISSPLFGQVTSVIQDSQRLMQLALRLKF